MPQPREIRLRLEGRADHVGSLKRLSVLWAAKPEQTNTLQGRLLTRAAANPTRSVEPMMPGSRSRKLR